MTKHQLATLPEFTVQWFYESAALKDGNGKRLVMFNDSVRAKQFEEILRRANAYPRLYAALRDTVRALDGIGADTSEQETARALLRELDGE